MPEVVTKKSIPEEIQELREATTPKEVTKEKEPTKEKPVQGKKVEPPVNKSKKEKPQERQIVYKEIEATISLGEDAIRAAKAQEYLGWSILPPESTEDPFLTDLEGNKVKLDHNDHNRPFDLAHAQKLAQDMLNGNWRFNGESIVIGETGLVLSGQHRLTALIFATQLWTRDDHWKKTWKEAPSIESLIVVGVKEDNETTRTLDNVKPRTYADVLYSQIAFRGTVAERKQKCKMTDYALRTIWERIGAKGDNYHKYRTHSEASDFQERHPKLKQVVEHILAEDVEGMISGKKGLRIGPGEASGLLYLMACCKADGEAYDKSPDEKHTNMNSKLMQGTVLTTAEDFWASIASKDPVVSAIRSAFVKEFETGPDGKEVESKRYIFSNEGGKLEKRSVLILAWNAFIEGTKLTPSVVLPEFTIDPDSRSAVMTGEIPTLGGIDKGESKATKELQEGDKKLPTMEEIAKAKGQEMAAHLTKKQMEKKQAVPTQPGQKASGEVPTPPKTKYDKDGKPPPLKLKKIPVKTSKDSKS